MTRSVAQPTCVRALLAEQVQELVDQAGHAGQRRRRRGRGPAGAGRSAPGTARRSRRPGGRASRRPSVRAGRRIRRWPRSRSRSAWKIAAEDGACEPCAQVREDRRDERLGPAHDRRRPVGAGLEGRSRRSPVNVPSWRMANRVGGCELGDLDRVRRRRCPGSGRSPRRGSRRRPARRQHAHGLHLAHPARLALDVGDLGPDPLDRRVDDDPAVVSGSVAPLRPVARSTRSTTQPATRPTSPRRSSARTDRRISRPGS